MTEPSQTGTWITAAKGGDRAALAKLLATCDPQMRARAEAKMDAALKGKRGPDDILQEAYLEVVRQMDRFEGCDLSAFLSWACVILDHKLVDAHRAAHCQARDVRREVPAGAGAGSNSHWDLLEHLYAESGAPSRMVRRQEALDALMASLSDLSEAQRQVIQLRFLEGLSVREVASRLNKSPGAVVAQTKRALDALHESMNQMGEFTRGPQ